MAKKPSPKLDRHTRELLAVELFKLEWQQTRWTDRLRDALGGCAIRDPSISTFRLFHLGLDLIGVPTESKSYCRDKWFDHYGVTVRREGNIPEYVAWALKERATEGKR
jgi:hypothetical protein